MIKKEHRIINFKKIMHEISSKVTAEELNDSFEKQEPRQYGMMYAERGAPNMRVILQVHYDGIPYYKPPWISPSDLDINMWDLSFEEQDKLNQCLEFINHIKEKYRDE